jgi:ProP effector
MSNASLKEQLQAVASQLSDTIQKKQSKPKPTSARRAPAPKPAPKAKPKPKWLDYAQYGVALLRTYFPACFKMGAEVKPLKKGIKQDLLKRLSEMNNITTDDKACMVKSLSFYVNTHLYHKSVLAGVSRLDLDGQPADVVTAEEAQYSIDRIQAKLQAKQAKVAKETTQTAQSKEVVSA